MNKTVVILLSDKRSGSTLFQRELEKHPEVETVTYSPHTYLETHHWLKAAVMLNLDAKLFNGNKRYNGYGSRANARTYMVDLIQGNVPSFKVPSTDKELIIDGWNALCNKFANPIFFEKSPQYISHKASLNLLLEWIRTTKYDVKVVGLIRNPMAVLYSANQLFYTDPNKRQYSWMNAYRNLEQFKNELRPDQYFSLKYEDMILEPQSTFNAVCDFIGLKRNNELGSGANEESLNKWKKDDDFYFKLNKEVSEFAMNNGYSIEELNNPSPTKPKDLSYYRTRLLQKYKLSKARIRDRIIKPILLRTKKRQ